jgi:hypothetical protein
LVRPLGYVEFVVPGDLLPSNAGEQIAAPCEPTVMVRADSDQVALVHRRRQDRHAVTATIDLVPGLA